MGLEDIVRIYVSSHCRIWSDNIPDLYFKMITMATLLRNDFKGQEQKEANQSGCYYSDLQRGDCGLDRGDSEGDTEWLDSKHLLQLNLTQFPAGLEMRCKKEENQG